MLKTASESDRLRSADQAAVSVQPTHSPLLHPVRTMAEARNLVAAIARAGKSCQQIKPLVGAATGDKTLSIS
jgi:hypothetical protein